MARTKVEKKLARDTWMRLYMAGTPVDVRNVAVGSLVIRYDPYPTSDGEVHNPEWEYEDYYPLVITGNNKKSMRCSVDRGGHFMNDAVPLNHGTMVVLLRPFKLSEQS